MIYMIKRGNLLVPINPPKSWFRQKPNGKNSASYINFYFRHVSDILKVSTLSVNPPNRGQTIILWRFQFLKH